MTSHNNDENRVTITAHRIKVFEDRYDINVTKDVNAFIGMMEQKYKSFRVENITYRTEALRRQPHLDGYRYKDDVSHCICVHYSYKTSVAVDDEDDE